MARQSVKILKGGEPELTRKQKIFADDYLVDLNATRAYLTAYPSVKKEETAAAAAARLLRNVKVAAYIQQRMEERQQRTEVTQDRVVQELAAIAFARATDYAEIQNNGITSQVIIKSTEFLSDAQVSAIAGIKEGANGIEIKLNDKEKALEMLGRHLGMWNDKLDLAMPVLDESIKAMEEYFEQQKKAGT